MSASLSGYSNAGPMTPITSCGRPSSRIVRPTMSLAAPNSRAHVRWLSIASPGVNVSSSRNVRPSIGGTPSTENRLPETCATAAGFGPPCVTSDSCWGNVLANAMPVNDVARARQSSMLAGAASTRFQLRALLDSQRATTRSGSSNGYGRSTVSLMAEKIATEAPIPRPSVRTAAVV